MEIESVAAALVGRVHIDLVQDRTALAMLKEALRRTDGNYTKAARLLGITRQGIQQMVARFDIRGFTEELRKREYPVDCAETRGPSCTSPSGRWEISTRE
jgi:hypothetical protein